MRKIFFHSWKRYVTGLVMSIVFVILYNISNKSWSLLMNYIDGTFIGGFVTICFGLLALVENHGAFDIFKYVFVKKKPDVHSLYDYVESQRVVRAKNKYCFVPYITVGAVFVIISAILTAFL